MKTTKILDESKRKPNKTWVDKGSEIYNRLMKFQRNNDIKIYSVYKEGKSVVTERFARTFETKIYKCMTLVL